MMARLTTMPVAPPSACRNRAAISCGSVSAKMQADARHHHQAEARQQAPAGVRSGRTAAPSKICEQAMPTM